MLINFKLRGKLAKDYHHSNYQNAFEFISAVRFSKELSGAVKNNSLWVCYSDENAIQDPLPLPLVIKGLITKEFYRKTEERRGKLS